MPRIRILHRKRRFFHTLVLSLIGSSQILFFQNCGHSFETVEVLDERGAIAQLSTQGPSPGATATPSMSPTPTASATPSPGMSPTPAPTASPQPTASPGASPTPQPTASPGASPTPTPQPTPEVINGVERWPEQSYITLKINQYQVNLRINPQVANQTAFAGMSGVDGKSAFVLSGAENFAKMKLLKLENAANPDVIFDLQNRLQVVFHDLTSDQIMVKSSPDAGVNWSNAVGLGMTVTNPLFAIDRSNGPYRGSLYVTGKASVGVGFLVGISRDNGATWSMQSARANAILDEGSAYGPVVLSDGTLLIPIRSKGIVENQKTTTIQAVLRSTDGGKSFETVMLPTITAIAPLGLGGYSGMSNLAAGTVNGRERVYFAFVQPRTKTTLDKGDAQLMLSTSDNGGKTWSKATAVAVSFKDGAASHTISVNKNGVLGLQFYTASTTGSMNRYFTFSKDGGATFSKPVSVGSSSAPQSGRVQFPAPIGSDYMYSDVSPNGDFFGTWLNYAITEDRYGISFRVLTVQ